jgi:SH3 domain-containing YSC84-like protein 1
MMIRIGVTFCALLGFAFAADSKSDVTKRIDEAAKVFEEVNNTPDKGIPQEILEKAQCIGIVPGLKRVGFIVGGKYGKGVVVCRSANDVGWSGPSTEIVEGGSIGLQIGAGETDLVFVVMNQGGMDKLLQDKFTVGGDAAAMAGPVGRSASAQTDAMMHAQILSWSRSRGAFAGITLTGSTLRPDTDSNRLLYGHEVTGREILTGKVRPPAAAQPLYAALNRYMPAKTKSAKK